MSIMFAIVNYLSQNLLIVAVFLLIIALLVRKDEMDKDNTKNHEIEPEETETIKETLYFESMSVDEKLKRILVELRKIYKLLPHENKLNNLHAASSELQTLQRKIDKTYQIEEVELVNAVSWLEKSLNTRGRYHPIAYDEDEAGNINVKDVKKTVQLLMTNEASDDDVINYDYDKKSNKKTKEILSKTSKKNTIRFKVPDVKLENILEIANYITQLWLLANVWSRILLDELLESLKIWFVVFMTTFRSIFSVTIFESALNTASTYLGAFIRIRTKVDKKNDLSTVTLVVFPVSRERSINGFYDFFLRTIAKVKSLFS